MVCQLWSDGTVDAAERAEKSGHAVDLAYLAMNPPAPVIQILSFFSGQYLI